MRERHILQSPPFCDTSFPIPLLVLDAVLVHALMQPIPRIAEHFADPIEALRVRPRGERLHPGLGTLNQSH